MLPQTVAQPPQVEEGVIVRRLNSGYLYLVCYIRHGTRGLCTFNRLTDPRYLLKSLTSSTQFSVWESALLSEFEIVRETTARPSSS